MAEMEHERWCKERRQTEGNGYSPLESLQYWIDIIAGGLEPSQIRILGINGGLISALEYRIALALEATVGVVAESGREVARLLQDGRWAGSEKLMLLPDDIMTNRAFLGSGGSRLEADIRETLAREIHEAYRLAKQDSLKADDPVMATWEKLPEDLKQSNFIFLNFITMNHCHGKPHPGIRIRHLHKLLPEGQQVGE